MARAEVHSAGTVQLSGDSAAINRVRNHPSNQPLNLINEARFFLKFIFDLLLELQVL